MEPRRRSPARVLSFDDEHDNGEPKWSAASAAILDLQAKVRALENENAALRAKLTAAQHRADAAESERSRLADVVRLGMPWIGASGGPGSRTHSLVAHLQRLEHLLRATREPNGSGATAAASGDVRRGVNGSGVCSRLGIHSGEELDEALRSFSDEELETVMRELELECSQWQSDPNAFAGDIVALENQLKLLRRGIARRRGGRAPSSASDVLKETMRAENSFTM